MTDVICTYHAISGCRTPHCYLSTYNSCCWTYWVFCAPNTSVLNARKFWYAKNVFIRKTVWRKKRNRTSYCPYISRKATRWTKSSGCNWCSLVILYLNRCARLVSTSCTGDQGVFRSAPDLLRDLVACWGCRNEIEWFNSTPRSWEPTVTSFALGIFCNIKVLNPCDDGARCWSSLLILRFKVDPDNWYGPCLTVPGYILKFFWTGKLEISHLFL